MSTPKANYGNDRRNYFRIDDDVVMTYRLIPQESLPETFKSLQRTLSDSGTLTATFTGISQKTRYLKKRIRKESSALADYLDSLESRLDMLARALLLRDMGINEKDTREVNLSAGGIEFHTPEPLPVGGLLEMKFVVFPSRHGILTGGKVIRCEPDPVDNSYHYKVAVEFAFIREMDRQLIIKHVLGKQSSCLRRRRALDQSGEEN